MSKFFVQLLLSVMIGLGAAAGFSPQGKGELNQTLHDAKASLRETASVTLKTAGDVTTKVNTSSSVSTQAEAKTSTKSNLKADTKVKSSFDAQVVTRDALLDNSSSKTSLDVSLKADAQTKANTDAQGIDLNIKDTIKSTLDVGLDLGK